MAKAESIQKDCRYRTRQLGINTARKFLLQLTSKAIFNLLACIFSKVLNYFLLC